MKAPVQTLVTYFARALWRRTKSIVSSSSIAWSTPKPPGTQMRSSGGQSANVVVGGIDSGQSDGTGSRVLATMWVVAPGRRCSTWSGPVKSSCVRLGKSTKPVVKLMGRLS